MKLTFINYFRSACHIPALLSALLFFTPARSQCRDVDLEAVSVEPALQKIGKGQTTTVSVVMRNNSTCPIAAGDATAQVTFSAVGLELGKDVNFRDDCGQWVYLGAVSNARQHNLFFRNNGGPIRPGDKNCSFHFEVKGKTVSAEPVLITMASSLSSEAKTGDINGSNQSASSQLIVVAAATPPAAPVAPPIADFLASTNECDAILKWKSNTPGRIDSFEVEYGATEDRLTKVGTVPAAKSAGELNFEFSHYQGNGKGYYRLTAMGKNGVLGRSKIILAETKCVVKKGFAP